MDDETKAVLIFVGAIALTLSTLFGCIAYYNVVDRLATERETIMAIERGYTRAILPGTSTPQWVPR